MSVRLAIYFGRAQAEGDGAKHVLRHRTRAYLNHDCVFEPNGRPVPGKLGARYMYARTVRYAFASNVLRLTYAGMSFLDSLGIPRWAHVRWDADRPQPTWTRSRWSCICDAPANPITFEGAS